MWRKTIRNRWHLNNVLCVQSSLASHRAVWLEVTNEILSVRQYFSLLSMAVVSFVRPVGVCSLDGFTLSSPPSFNLARHDSSAPVPVFPYGAGAQGWVEWEGGWLIQAGPAALVQRGAGSRRRREMIEVAYDERIGDETRPLKGNYFCSYISRVHY